MISFYRQIYLIWCVPCPCQIKWYYLLRTGAGGIPFFLFAGGLCSILHSAIVFISRCPLGSVVGYSEAVYFNCLVSITYNVHLVMKII